MRRERSSKIMKSGQYLLSILLGLAIAILLRSPVRPAIDRLARSALMRPSRGSEGADTRSIAPGKLIEDDAVANLPLSASPPVRQLAESVTTAAMTLDDASVPVAITPQRPDARGDLVEEPALPMSSDSDLAISADAPDVSRSDRSDAAAAEDFSMALRSALTNPALVKSRDPETDYEAGNSQRSPSSAHPEPASEKEAQVEAGEAESDSPANAKKSDIVIENPLRYQIVLGFFVNEQEQSLQPGASLRLEPGDKPHLLVRYHQGGESAVERTDRLTPGRYEFVVRADGWVLERRESRSN